MGPVGWVGAGGRASVGSAVGACWWVKAGRENGRNGEGANEKGRRGLCGGGGTRFLPLMRR